MQFCDVQKNMSSIRGSIKQFFQPKESEERSIGELRSKESKESIISELGESKEQMAKTV